MDQRLLTLLTQAARSQPEWEKNKGRVLRYRICTECGTMKFMGSRPKRIALVSKTGGDLGTPEVEVVEALVCDECKREIFAQEHRARMLNFGHFKGQVLFADDTENGEVEKSEAESIGAVEVSPPVA